MRKPKNLGRLALNKRSGRPRLKACDAQNMGHNCPHAVGFPIRNYLDDGPQEARFIELADAVVQELGLTQALAECEALPLGDHGAVRWRFSVLQLWRFATPFPS